MATCWPKPKNKIFTPDITQESTQVSYFHPLSRSIATNCFHFQCSAVPHTDLINIKATSERGVIVHVNGTGCLQKYVNRNTSEYRRDCERGFEHGGQEITTYLTSISWNSASRVPSTGALISNRRRMHAMLRKRVRIAKCLPGQIL